MQAKIIIIDDEYKPIFPLIIDLKEKFGEENILLFNQAQEGLDYVLAHLSQKIILVLDWDFGAEELDGFQVFTRITDKTFLIYTIFVSGIALNRIDNKQLLQLINNHAFSFIQKGTSYTKIFDKVVEATHLLATRLDCAIEEWIDLHSSEERNKPYISTRGGKTHTLNDLLYEIRKKTDLGMTMERNILQLTLDLLARQKKQVHD